MTDVADYYNGALSELLGKTLTSVTRDGVKEIIFATDNAKWRMYYEPDCCASAEIEDIVGDLEDLVGSPILMAEAVTNSDNPKTYDGGYADESHTWTFYKLATAKGYVTIRWYGSSNGYYSETASFSRVGGES